MSKKHKNEQWVFYKDIEGQTTTPGVVRKVLAYSDDTMCVENTFEEGTAVPPHGHPHTQIAYVASGRFRFTIGSEVREVGKGDTLCMRNGVMHGCVCLEKGVVLDSFTPIREDFL